MTINTSILAEPVDQGITTSSVVQQIEKRQHSWPDGRTYNGEWSQDQPQGQGMMTYPDGSQYWGQFQAGSRQGKGALRSINGDEYEGEWFADQPQGKGTWHFADGAVHKGQFSEGLATGKGTRRYTDGSRYEGQWKQGIPHGFGQLDFVSGDHYEGEFQQGKPHGQGVWQSATGDLYSGQWKNGQQDGKGRLDYATGGFFEGRFVQGKRQGSGLWVSALGERYEGPFSNNQANGNGRCGTPNRMQDCTYRNGVRAPTTKTTTPVIAAAIIPQPPAVAVPQAVTPPQPQLVELEAKETAVKVEAEVDLAIKTEVSAQPSLELPPDQSSMLFSTNQNRPMPLPGQAWWKKHASLFRDQLEIVSRHGDTRIRLLVDNYKGPGQYSLARIQVDSPNPSLAVDSKTGGQIHIQEDQSGWIRGQFQLSTQTANGQPFTIDDGKFHISDAGQQTSFLH